MSQSPTKRIYLGNADTGIDLSDYISTMTYKRSLSKDNELTFSSQGKSAEFLLSLDDFYPNSILTFSYGFITGDMSTTKTVVILDIEPTYSSNGLVLKIRAVDKGHTLKKVTSTRIWKNKSTEDIVTEVSQLHGLKTAIVPVDSSLEGSPNPSSVVWDQLPQGNANDMQLVQSLATKIPGAEYISYVDNDVLYFKPVGTSQDSRRTIDIADASIVNSFSIKHRESVNSAETGLAKALAGTGEAAGTRENAKSIAQLAGPNFLGNIIMSVANGLIYRQQGKDNAPLRDIGYRINAITGEKSVIPDLSPVISKGLGMILPAGDNVTKVNPVKSERVDEPSQKGFVPAITGAIGDSAEKFIGSITNLPESLDDEYTMGENKVVGSNVSESELKAMAQSKQSKSTRKLLTATLVVYGDPTWELDTVITIAGVSERFIGNWYIESIQDDIRSPYMTTIELTKNAVKISKNGVQAKNINNTVGEVKADSNGKKSTNEKVRINAVDGTIYSDSQILVPGYSAKANIGKRT